MRFQTGPAPRAGFTLIELLIVIAIIVLLAALSLVGFSGAKQRARALQTTSNLRDLDAAVTSFKNKFNGMVPPSHIVEQATDGTYHVRRFEIPSRTDTPEYRFFRRMFPRWDPENQPGGLDPADSTGKTIAVGFRPAHWGTTLDNNQVLVYFLGGPNNQGWSLAGPFQPPATGNTKIPPFFEFPVGEQLVANGTPVPHFVDPNGIPYAYFSGNNDNDRYNERAHFPWNSTATATFNRTTTTATYAVAPLTYDPSTDTTATKTAHPLRSPGSASVPGKWLAPGRWQIISAGRDKQFGYGSPMLPTMVISDYVPGVGPYELKQPGEDDMSSFTEGNLGVTP